MTDESKFNVLVVDDDAINLQILCHALKDKYIVSTAISGESAIKKAQADKPDLILLDIMMVDMNGYEVLAKLKNLKETCNIPVIFITGLSSTEDETKGLVMGAVDYITKPIKVGIVQARVKTHLKIVEQMRTIERLGMVDPLTDIANRRKFDWQFTIEWARAIREQIPISLLMFDVDNFKSYNDTYGHPMGDALLQTLAKTLAAHARRPADLAARIGGEEFVVLLPNTNLDNAKIVGENIRAAIEGLAMPSGIDPNRPVTVSIGAASIIPGKDSVREDFIALSDKNLYTAKHTGKNRVCG